MISTPRYLGRGSWLGRRDPRVPLLVGVLAAATVIQIWDIRIVAVLFILGQLYYRTAGIPFRLVRKQWAFAIVFVSILVLVNTILTGGEIGDYDRSDLHVLFHLPLIGTPISAESLSYGATQLLRFLTFITIGFPIAYAIAPSDLGPALARLRIPEKFAFGVDLTYRFIPSLAADLQETIDAQRVRGYEWDKGKGGPIARVRRTVPLIVPLTMNAIVGAEDTIDAMDLRGFGTGRRTWLRELRYDRDDRLLVGIALGIFAAITVLSVAGLTKLWVFPPLLAAAGG
ncbi:MAG TPA: energy-coupling factor transporter transmembrane component T [Candidatus Limnocylindrales bacterium]|nr:energy-coupling factor transporter transmembrane component T [Candidatus Limnocylindrales bacterium]